MTPLIAGASRIFHDAFIGMTFSGNRTHIGVGEILNDMTVIVDLYGDDSATFSLPQVTCFMNGRELLPTRATITSRFRDEGQSHEFFDSNSVTVLNYDFTTADVGLYFCLFSGVVTVDILFGFPIRLDSGEPAS